MDPRAQGLEMRQMREKKRVSLRDMAKRLDISAPYLSDLELGRRGWNTDLMERYKNALKK